MSLCFTIYTAVLSLHDVSPYCLGLRIMNITGTVMFKAPPWVKCLLMKRIDPSSIDWYSPRYPVQFENNDIIINLSAINNIRNYLFYLI